MADYTILVIDYEPRSVEKLRVPLEGAGYRVEVAKDGKEGIVTFHKLLPSAVIIEAMLPKRHGFEVCQELKQTPHGAACPVMIATAVYRGRKYRHQAKHLYGCDAYLEKPLADEDLLEAVRTAIEGYESMRPAAQGAETIAMEIDTGNVEAEIPAVELALESPPADAPRQPQVLPLQPQPAPPQTQPAPPRAQAAPPQAQPAAPRAQAAPPQPQPAPPSAGKSAAAAATEENAEFEILDRLDSLLSDDPSKSSPTRSDE